MDKSQVSFLDLPKHIRVKIYHHAHLTRPCAINLATEGDRQQKAHRIRGWPYTCNYQERINQEEDRLNPEQIDCLCLPLPHHLLLTCKAIHDEVEPLLYGLNKFGILPAPEKSPNHLKVLNSLSASAWHSMTSLHVSLTAEHNVELSRDIPDDEVLLFDPRYSDLPQQELPGPQILHKDASTALAIMAAWEATSKLLRDRLSPSQIHLSLACSTDDVGLAGSALKSLRRLPDVKTCQITFGRSGGSELKAMAKARSLQMTSKDALSRIRGSFDDLPKEIRLLILSFTNLICRSQRPQCRKGLYFEDHRIRQRGLLCCGQCTDTLAVCCCVGKGGSFSDRCNCYKIPKALFLINSRLYDDAYQVFFSQNRFLLGSYDFDKTRDWIERLPSRACLLFREIEIGMKYLIHLVKDPGGEKSQSWNAFLETVKNRMQVGKLWLIIDAAGREEHLLRHEDDQFHDGKGNFQWLKADYEGAMKPLRKHLRGLRKLHIMLSWFPEYETALEQEIVGPGYDSLAEGKKPFGTINRGS